MMPFPPLPSRHSGLSILVAFALGGCVGADGGGSGPRDSDFWPAPAEGARPKVLVIGIDGVRVDVLREVPTPELDALAAAGFFTDAARNVRPTVSGPCWSSLLIGAGPAKHGVLSNDFSTNRYGEFPDFLTRIERVRPDLSTFAAVDWLPLGTEDAGGPLISDAIDHKHAFDGYELGWLEADSVSVMTTVEELRTGDPDALFVYLGAPDEISHNIGGIGDEYRAAISAADRHVGRLVDAVKSRAAFSSEDWLILVSTDHGRTEAGGHGGDSAEETTVFFLASGPSASAGPPTAWASIMDVAVTALVHLGIGIEAGWELDGQAVGLAGAVRPTDTLRILAYNTHHGEGMDGILDLARIADLIRSVDPDVVTLQEIDQVVERTGGVDQPGEYGSLTGMQPIFGDFMPYQGGAYGMALLSRLPIVDWTNHRLPSGAEPRSTLAARVRFPTSGREAVIAGIHFYRTEEERLAQAARTIELLEVESVPVVLAGDFNSQPGSAVMALLGERWASPDKTGGSFTFPADGPEREIDFILIRPKTGFRVLEYRVLDETVASDHRPIFMVVELF